MDVYNDMKSRDIFLFAHFVNDFSEEMIVPILPLLIGYLGITYFEGGLLITLIILLSSVLTPVIAHFADLKGKRKSTIVTGFIIIAFAIILYSLSNNYWMFISASILLGIGSSTYHPPAMAFISEASEKWRGRSLGIHGISGNMGSALAPALIALFIATIGWRHGLLWIVPIPILTALALWRLLKVKEVKQEVKRGHTRIKVVTFPLLILGGVASVVIIVLKGLLSFTPAYYVNRGFSPIFGNVIVSICFAMGFIAKPIGGAISDVIGRRKIILISFSFTSFLILVFSLTPLIGSYIFLFLASFTIYLASPAIHTYAVELGGPEFGASLGIVFGMSGAIGAVSPAILGSIIDLFNFEYAFRALSVIMLIPAILLILLPEKRRVRKKEL